ncbi:hypothetical protein [Streptomyces goshikiensis]|uniref:hypothetical protein n=1 Tax=Streptomyces goshikiensis TaxID=1942 RepID=UPI0036C02057
MSSQREAIVRREMADPTYAGTWHIRDVAVNGVDVWEVTHGKTVLATLPDWGGNVALWIADARDDVPQLLALVDQLRAELTESNAKLKIAERQNSELVDVIAGTGLALYEEERESARLRLAWQSARTRANSLGEGLLREVGNRDAWKTWAKAAESEVVRLRALVAERDEQIANLLAAEPTLDDDQPGAPR